MLAGYGAVACIAYGFLLNLWFWPFTAGLPEQIAFTAGAPMGENLAAWLRFCLITSLGYDIPRAALTVVLILVGRAPGAAGPATHVAQGRLRRTRRVRPGGRQGLTDAHHPAGHGLGRRLAQPVLRLRDRAGPSATPAAPGRPARRWSTSVVLIDCGPTTPHLPAAAGVTLQRVEHVLVTHGHPDHLHPAFLLTRRWTSPRTTLHVWGPPLAMDLCRDWLGPDSMVELHVLAPGHDVELATTRRHLSRSARCRPSTATGTATSSPRRRCSTPSPDRTATGCCTPPTPARWPRRRLGLLDAPFDAVLVDETFGDKPDHGTGHLDLATLPGVLRSLRDCGAVTAATVVAATHLSHHNPPAPRAARAARRARRRRSSTTSTSSTPPGPAAGWPGAISSPAAHARASRPWPSASPATGVAVTYVATSGQRPDDDEWQHRVALHRARRPAHWSTVETTDVAGVLAAAPAGSVVLVDCLALWLTAQLDEIDAWQRCEAGLADQVRAEAAARATALVDALEGSAADVVLVTNEVGMGVVPGHRVGPALPRPPRHPQRPGRGRLPGDDAGRGRDPRAPQPDERDDDPCPLNRYDLPTLALRPTAAARQARLTKPAGALGRLEDASVWMSAVQGRCPPAPFTRPALVIFAGDHGVARTAATSAYPPEVTAQMVANFATGGAAANVLARQVGATVRVVDVSVDADPSYLDAIDPAICASRVRRGSGSIDREDAMTVDEASAAIALGARLADEAADAGADVLIAGDMGIGNTTPAATLIGLLTGHAADDRDRSRHRHRRRHPAAQARRPWPPRWRAARPRSTIRPCSSPGSAAPTSPR